MAIFKMPGIEPAEVSSPRHGMPSEAMVALAGPLPEKSRICRRCSGLMEPVLYDPSDAGGGDPFTVFECDDGHEEDADG